MSLSGGYDFSKSKKGCKSLGFYLVLKGGGEQEGFIPIGLYHRHASPWNPPKVYSLCKVLDFLGFINHFLIGHMIIGNLL